MIAAQSRLSRLRVRIVLAARELTAARQGIAAVEFALILPVLITLYVGMTELSRALSNSRKIAQLGRTLADLVSRGGATLTQSNMDDIYAASSAVLAPFDASAVKMTVSAVAVYKNGSNYQAYICSSSAKNTTQRPVGLATAAPNFPTIPDAFKVDGMRYLVSEVTADYVPVIGQTFITFFAQTGGKITFNNQTTWPVRNGQTQNSSQTEVVLPKNNTACPKTIS